MSLWFAIPLLFGAFCAGWWAGRRSMEHEDLEAFRDYWMRR